MTIACISYAVVYLILTRTIQVILQITGTFCTANTNKSGISQMTFSIQNGLVVNLKQVQLIQNKYCLSLTINMYIWWQAFHHALECLF